MLLLLVVYGPYNDAVDRKTETIVVVGFYFYSF
jgi:hypothetical protein